MTFALPPTRRKKKVDNSLESKQARALKALGTPVREATANDRPVRETAEETFARYQREEQYEIDRIAAQKERELLAQEELKLAPVRAAERALNATMLTARNHRAAALLTIPSSELAELIPSENVTENLVPRIREAFNTFRLSLENQGVKLHESFTKKLLQISEVNPSLRWSDAETFRQVFLYGSECGVWTESDLTLPPTPEVKREQPKTKSFDEILATERDPDVLRNAVFQQAMGVEAKETWSGWESSLYTHFGYTLPEKVGRTAAAWFQRQNRSYLDKSAYDDCRKAFVKEGLMPAHLLTRSEQFEIEMDGLNLDTVEGQRRANQLHRASVFNAS